MLTSSLLFPSETTGATTADPIQILPGNDVSTGEVTSNYVNAPILSILRLIGLTNVRKGRFRAVSRIR